MTDTIADLMKKIERNGMKAVYVENRSEVLNVVKDMLKPSDVVASGGSVTLDECGIIEFLSGGQFNFLYQDKAGLTPSEKAEVNLKSMSADVYFSSANAITSDGVLYNVDGRSNRIAAIAFGTKKVVIVVGVNKIVANVKEAVERVKKIAAPKNCVRLKKNTYCAKFGICEALKDGADGELHSGCNSVDRICRHYIFTGPQAIKERITVILVNESLGY